MSSACTVLCLLLCVCAAFGLNPRTKTTRRQPCRIPPSKIELSLHLTTTFRRSRNVGVPPTSCGNSTDVNEFAHPSRSRPGPQPACNSFSPVFRKASAHTHHIHQSTRVDVVRSHVKSSRGSPFPVVVTITPTELLPPSICKWLPPHPRCLSQSSQDIHHHGQETVHQVVNPCPDRQVQET